MGIECRTDDTELRELLAPLHHASTAVCVEAERAMNRRLEGGCQVPIACYAVREDNQLWLRGLVGAVDGSTLLYEEDRGPEHNAEAMGIAMAERLLAAGADKILAEVYGRDVQ